MRAFLAWAFLPAAVGALPVSRPPLRGPLWTRRHPAVALELADRDPPDEGFEGDPSNEGFGAGFRGAMLRMRSTYQNASARAAAELQSQWSAERVAQASTAQQVVAATVSSAAISESLLWGGATVGAWALGLGDASAASPRLCSGLGVRLGAAAASATALRRCCRPTRLALEIGLARLLFLRAQRTAAPLVHVRERAVQCIAIVACLLLTLRALDRGPLAALQLAPLASLSPPLYDAALSFVASVQHSTTACLNTLSSIGPLRLLGSLWARLAAGEDALAALASFLYTCVLAPALRWLHDLYMESWLRVVLRSVRGVLFQTLLG
jgi:hypothetical protein